MNEEKLMKSFGKRVALVRKSKGVTQQQLAENIGMSVVAIAYIETGKRWARLGTLNIRGYLGTYQTAIFQLTVTLHRLFPVHCQKTFIGAVLTINTRHFTDTSFPLCIIKNFDRSLFV